MKLEKLKQKIQEFAVEVSEYTFNDSRTVIAFTDYTFSVVTGSWEAQKPVWVAFSGLCTEQEVYQALLQGYESPEGIPLNLMWFLVYPHYLLFVVRICEEL